MNTTLRENLINQADAAFLALISQVDELLDTAQLYFDERAPVTRSDKMKAKDLEGAVKDLGNLLPRIAAEIERWKREDERMLSRLGVEVQLLNELYATMEATMLFFIAQDYSLRGFNLGLVKRAHVELVRCNRLL